MTLTGQSNGDPGDLPGMYSESIGQYRAALAGLGEIGEAREHVYEWLAEYSRFAGAVSAILNAHCAYFEGSWPADPMDIHRHMIGEMEDLRKLRDFLVEDLRLYDTASFRVVLSGCTKVVGAAIANELDSLRRNVRQELTDSVRVAMLDLSNKRASSKQQVRSRAAALRRLSDVAQGWFTLSEELKTAARLWQQKGSA